MSKGENMVEMCAKAADKAMGGVSLAFTGEQAGDTDLSRRLRKQDTDRAYAVARAVIEELIEEPASGTLLARVEEVARSLNRHRTEDHIKSVALDSLSVHREILRFYLRTALSQPNDEGEGK